MKHANEQTSDLESFFFFVNNGGTFCMTLYNFYVYEWWQGGAASFSTEAATV